jgi:3-deoxy-7-phosphoheptulonate synthase/chorismate mutase-like protein
MQRKATRAEGSPDKTIVQVGRVRIGYDPFPVIAGPCAIESESQMMAAAEMVASAGAAVLRGNAYKMGTTPYAFRGLGDEGVVMLARAGREVGLPTVTQVLEPADVNAVADQVDMIEIHSGAMQNFELLRMAGKAGKPVLLRRGPSATIDEWLWSAEYLLAEANDQVVLVERGIRTFGSGTTDMIDISSVPTLKELSHLPVIVDPSHASGGAAKVAPLALAAQGVGADGLIVEVHPSPAEAKSEGPLQLDGDQLAALMFRLGVNRMRAHIDLVDREIVRLLARRQDMSLEIGRVKATRGLPVRAPERERELLDIIRQEAEIQGIRPDHVEALFALVLEESRLIQEAMRGE